MTRKSHLIFLTAFLLISTGVSAQATYKIKLTNLENKKGDVYIGWYTNPSDFMKPKKATIAKIVPVNGVGQVIVSFNRVPAGKYAISAFLDENGDKDLNLGFFGKPTEKYGFSNEIRPTMRPAFFSEAAFDVNGKDGEMTIELK
ncbi:DUF2141 domain-containing protein [Chitinophaga rhizosphaerae]|uniref:DUF2141 domain-containing protein n=1 Tax=Chitinophaga rhizosphaerae TaxID=1864947 RepID=UPI0013DF7980|nr:DUF2141 domain-containing protein [Chitinophaga rhizosphaerae]